MISHDRFIYLLLILFVVIAPSLQADPVITVDVDEIETDLNTGDIEELIFNIFNDGDELLQYTITHTIIAEPERDGENLQERPVNLRNQIGPSRDDLGDQIAEYGIGRSGWAGLAWDGELMWGIGFEQGMIGFDPVAEEIARELNPGGFHMGLTYDGEAFWTGTLVDQDEVAFLQRIDLEGNVVQTIQVRGIAISGVAYDGENLWYYTANMDPNGWIRPIIRQITTDGEELREINCENLFRPSFLTITYVPEHDDGALWVIYWGESTLHQLDIAEDNPEILQQTQVLWNEDQDQTYGLDHDGENLWYSNGGDTWYVIDDGLGESSWISFDPDEGEIDAGGDEDILVILDATGLIEGAYEAEIHIISNDPDNDDVVINVLMNITGVPIIDVIWEEEIGYPDVINWNEAYFDLFPGVSYEIGLTIGNIGTAPLFVENITCEEGAFSSDQVEFDINPGGEIQVNFVLEADDEGLYESEMLVIWNSPDDENFVIPLRARTILPPIIEADQMALESELEIGESEEFVLNISNTGSTELRFNIEHEIISEPEEDLIDRSINRNIHGKSGPRRDDFGDIISEYNMEEWFWSDLAYDGELMWGITPNGNMIAINPETGEVTENANVEGNEFHGMAFDGESFWLGNAGGDNDWRGRLIRVDGNGNFQQMIQVQGWFVSGVTFDGENLWFFSLGEDDEGMQSAIRQITPEGEILRVINTRNILDGMYLAVAYVPQHEDGNLWVLEWETRILYQLDISGDDPEIVRQTELNGAQYFGLEHDGENLWYSTINDVWYVLDDGIRESFWFTYDPETGEVEADGDLDIFVIIDATELVEGVYEAEMHILSNDPETPDLAVNVVLNAGPVHAPFEASIADDFQLYTAYPNPFNSSTIISYNLPTSTAVSFHLCDITGRQVTELFNGEKQAGKHSITVSANELASGLYYIRMAVSERIFTHKLLLLR